ncbi:MAG: hypothetical protein M3044_19540 [Thermoproteota archaeon]|nr:hypothetical protein [Thermoproteota archaeon]
MENQCSHENDDSCGCSCHPGSGAGGCSGCGHMHGSGKMGSMDPFEMVMAMWHKATFAAYSELMVEKLKKRIEAANGPVMDKVADALMESMGKEFEAVKQKSSAKKELHEKLAKIFSEGSQKQK